MSWEIVALIVSGASIVLAVLHGRQLGIFLAVAVYAAILRWIIRHEMTLLMPALSLAIGLAVLGLAVILYRDVAVEVLAKGYGRRPSRADRNRAA